MPNPYVQKSPPGDGTPGGQTTEVLGYRNIDARTVKEAMRGLWLDYLAATCPALHAPISTVGTNRHHPAPGCHVSRNGDAFRFLPDAADTGLGICNTCGLLDTFRLLELQLGWGFAWALRDMAACLGLTPGATSSLQVEPTVIKRPVDTRQPSKTAWRAIRRLWQEGVSLNASEAEPARRYLMVRGLGELITQAGAMVSVRFHTSCPYWFQPKSGDKPVLAATYPAILLLVMDIDGKVVTIHRLYLTPDGKKATPMFEGISLPSRKKMTAVYPGASRGAAVRLFPPGPVLGVGEGMETCLAAYLLHDGAFPVWSAVDAGGLEAIHVPDIVREVVVLADRDPSGKGERAAANLEQRMVAQGRIVRVLAPPSAFGEKADWNDVLLKGGAYVG